ncbi:Esterase TesA [Alcanivorax sp. ALC70]|nr:Esterase TesA [Alcanivorax sp. ALC70]
MFRIAGGQRLGERRHQRWGRVRLPALLERHQPDTVVIELGGNDGLRGLPPRRLAGNLETMIRLSREAGAEPVLLGMRIPPNYGRAYTRLFEQAFKDVATDTGVPFLPFLLDGVVEAGQLQGDGIHPTAEAQPRLLDNAWPVIETALPDEACE